jgi:hypothetical protein
MWYCSNGEDSECIRKSEREACSERDFAEVTRRTLDFYIYCLSCLTISKMLGVPHLLLHCCFNDLRSTVMAGPICRFRILGSGLALETPTVPRGSRHTIQAGRPCFMLRSGFYLRSPRKPPRRPRDGVAIAAESHDTSSADCCRFGTWSRT